MLKKVVRPLFFFCARGIEGEIWIFGEYVNSGKSSVLSQVGNN